MKAGLPQAMAGDSGKSARLRPPRALPALLPCAAIERGRIRRARPGPLQPPVCITHRETQRINLGQQRQLARLHRLLVEPRVRERRAHAKLKLGADRRLVRLRNR